jgi:hypothetical protein
VRGHRASADALLELIQRPRVSLAHLPTPFEPLPRLSGQLAGRSSLSSATTPPALAWAATRAGRWNIWRLRR